MNPSKIPDEMRKRKFPRAEDCEECAKKVEKLLGILHSACTKRDQLQAEVDRLRQPNIPLLGLEKCQQCGGERPAHELRDHVCAKCTAILERSQKT